MYPKNSVLARLTIRQKAEKRLRFRDKWLQAVTKAMQFSRRRYAPAGKEAKGCCQWFGRRVCGAVLSVSHCPDAAPQCLLAKAPKGTKNAFVPRRQAKTPAVFFDGAELAGGVVWFSSCRQGVGKPLFTLTPMAGVRLLVRAGNYR